MKSTDMQPSIQLQCLDRKIEHQDSSPINSSPPSPTYMRQWTGSSLLQVMACRLFGAKPLPEPMLIYCQLDSWEHISVKFESEFYHFHSRKCSWKCRLPKWRPFCPGGDELMATRVLPMLTIAVMVARVTCSTPFISYTRVPMIWPGVCLCHTLRIKTTPMTSNYDLEYPPQYITFWFLKKALIISTSLCDFST